MPRHGEGHYYNPSEVNYRANIFALKVRYNGPSLSAPKRISRPRLQFHHSTAVLPSHAIHPPPTDARRRVCDWRQRRRVAARGDCARAGCPRRPVYRPHPAPPPHLFREGSVAGVTRQRHPSPPPLDRPTSMNESIRGCWASHTPRLGFSPSPLPIPCSGIVGHVSVAHPVCEGLRAYLRQSCEDVGATFHNGGALMLPFRPLARSISPARVLFHTRPAPRYLRQHGGPRLFHQGRILPLPLLGRQRALRSAHRDPQRWTFASNQQSTRRSHLIPPASMPCPRSSA